MAHGGLPCRPFLLDAAARLQTRTVQDEDVRPSIVVVVDEGDTGAVGLDDEALLINTSVNGGTAEARLGRDVHELRPGLGNRSR